MTTTDGDHETSGAFPLTRWELVADVNRVESSVRERATAELCRIYWYPLYAFVRRKGYSAPDAEDVTQELFARLIGKAALGAANKDRGKLRTYLLTAINRLLTEQWRRQKAQKRGGDVTILSIEAEEAEKRYANEPRTEESPETIFDRRWAYALLGEVEKRLEQDYRKRGKEDLFRALKSRLGNESDDAIPYAEIAEQLGMKPSNIKVQMHRLRERFRQFVRQEVKETVSQESDADEELQHLFAALRG